MRPASLFIAAVSILTCAPHLAPTRALGAQRVMKPVKGLMDSVPMQWRARLGRFDIETHLARGNGFESEVRFLDESGEKVKSMGLIRSRFSRLADAWVVSNASLKTPSFIDHPSLVPLVEGRGVPTFTLVALQQMKLAGVEPGGLKKAIVANVVQKEMALDLLRDPEVRTWLAAHPGERLPLEIVSRKLADTALVRYIETPLIQSGHRIVSVKAEESPRSDQRELGGMFYWSTEAKRLTQGLPETSSIPWAFTAVLELEPRAKDGAPKPGARLKGALRALVSRALRLKNQETPATGTLGDKL